MLDATHRKPHWIARMNHRVRSGVFGAMLLSVTTHLYGQSHSAWLWVLLVLQFLVYPHLVYWITRKSNQPMRREMQALALDPFLMGAWLAWLGFPLWIAFPVSVGTLISISVYRGWRGLLEASCALVAGASVSAAFWGLRLQPDTSPLTTGLSMTSMAMYLLLVAMSAHARGLQLRSAREKLRQNEQDLQQQLAEIQALQSQLLEQANKDPLTGLYNRRYLDATLAREWARCQREHQPLSLIAIDIDHFKHINDSHGHAAGDAMLCAIASLLAEKARTYDVVCRYGGEEFLLMLPNASETVARERAEECRSLVENMALSTEFGTLTCTLSVGVACYPLHAASVQTLQRLADHALYRAKQQGRNRVVVASAPFIDQVTPQLIAQ